MASSRAGELYGLQALDTSIQDDQDNFTCVSPALLEPEAQC